MNTWVGVAALTYAGIGVVSLVRPGDVPRLFGGRAETSDSRTEIRAVYGGLPLAIAGTLVATPSAAPSMAALSAGMAGGRLLGILTERGRPRGATLTFLGVEAALAAALVAGTGELRRRSAGVA